MLRPMGNRPRRLLFPALAAVAVGAAVAIGVVAFGAGDGVASCDTNALMQAMHDGIVAAGRQGDVQAAIAVPAGCTDSDLERAMPRVSRDWHVMPGGLLMHEGEHSGP